jgi:tricorn protease
MIRRLAVHGFLVLGLLSGAGAAPRAELTDVTTPAVSPDGKAMVFEWLDDLWTASIKGGEAVRVEENPARDTVPQFTPDGKRIVFSSDRSGAMQIYSIPAGGGEATRHTWQTEGNELECISPDGTRAIVRGQRERAGFRATGLFVIDLTQDTREQRLFDAVADGAAWSPDGKRVLFCTRGEQLYRQGYHGSRASQIWCYDIPSGKFEVMVADDFEARLPVWQPDGKGFYYLSNRTGTLNLWSQRDGQSKPEMLTKETGDGLIARFPPADRATFMFHCGLELLRFRPGADAAPLPVRLWTTEKLPGKAKIRRRLTRAASADFTPDLAQVVFAAGGELWWKRGPDGEARRLTDTIAAESDVRFAPDGKALYFLRDDGLEPNYFRVRLVDGALVDEKPVTRGAASKSRLKQSPDGKRIAWVEGNGDVMGAAADGSKARKIFPCWDMPTFDWSPDGRCLVIAAEDRDANRDLWLAAADGDRPPLNLTRTPGFEGSPRWSPDGRWLVFATKRGGISGLSRIDFGERGFDATMTDERLQHLADRAKLLETGGMVPMRVLWAADSRSLLFQNRRAADNNLYSLPMAGGPPAVVAEQRGVPIRAAGNGALLWRVDQTPAVLKDGKTTLFAFSASVVGRRSDRLALGFRRIWRTLGERFYDATMNGRDWDALREKYEAAAAAARTSRQFDRVVSQLFGELNASHLSFLRKPWSGETTKVKKEKATAHPGLIFRDGPQGGPLVIARVIAGCPVAELKDAPQPGETVTRIAGEPVSRHSPLHRFLNGGVDKVLPVVIRGKNGNERVIALRCISYARARALDRENREMAARETVAMAGKFLYLPVRSMSMDSFSALELAVFRADPNARGMILDFRDNGGGREADRMVSLFCQPKHSFTIPRGGPRGYPAARRVNPAWTQPLVVLCNQNSFSNAEVFCHAMLATRRAPLVGVTTAGGVISTVKTSIPDVGELAVPFRGWFETRTGKNLDLNGAVPDFPVELTPADEDAGGDPQLAKAIEVLKAEILDEAKPADPVYRK